MNLTNKIVCGDSREVLKDIPDNSVDIIVSSPPYKTSDFWSPELMKAVFEQAYRVLKLNSLFYLNMGHLAEDKFRPFETCGIALYCGFELNETIVWAKNHYRPIQGHKRLNNLTEFIFLLHKGNMPKLDRLAIGVPYQDPSNAKRFAGGRNLRCGGNLWPIDYETIQSRVDLDHPDRFPLELPLKCLKLSGLKTGIVLDFFGGSSTTALAAKKLNLDFISIDKNPGHCKIGQERIFKETGFKPEIIYANGD